MVERIRLGKRHSMIIRCLMPLGATHNGKSGCSADYKVVLNGPVTVSRSTTLLTIFPSHAALALRLRDTVAILLSSTKQHFAQGLSLQRSK